MNLRITVDIDNKANLEYSLKQGYKLLKRRPDVIRESPNKRGYHLIWYNVNCSEEEMFKFRKLIGDDPVRIKLDKKVKLNFKQVLFTKKKKEVLDNGSKNCWERKK